MCYQKIALYLEALILWVKYSLYLNADFLPRPPRYQMYFCLFCDRENISDVMQCISGISMTSVEVKSYFPDKHRIHVAFNSFLSRTWPNIKNWEQVTNIPKES